MMAQPCVRQSGRGSRLYCAPWYVYYRKTPLIEGLLSEIIMHKSFPLASTGRSFHHVQWMFQETEGNSWWGVTILCKIMNGAETFYLFYYVRNQRARKMVLRAHLVRFVELSLLNYKMCCPEIVGRHISPCGCCHKTNRICPLFEPCGRHIGNGGLIYRSYACHPRLDTRRFRL